MNVFARIYHAIRNDVTMESADLNSRRLLEWLGIDPDQEKPEALSETTYYTCLKVLSETMG